ncbi:uncharacterized protein [Paramisgurnus dabryanus]|uniref:uncharacterized protein n=1 Tax=Paramisgurnus dabryanus TaxID=90735 RepID=UPI0031F3C959
MSPIDSHLLHKLNFNINSSIVMCIFIFYCLFFLIVKDVFGNKVSVMEGDSVTLHTDIVRQKDDRIVWYYGPENTFVARISKMSGSILLSEDERFRDRVMVNDQTGDLIITNIRTQHSGDYTLKISRNNKVSYKKFNVTVHAHQPVLTNPIRVQNNSPVQRVFVISVVYLMFSVICIIICVHMYCTTVRKRISSQPLNAKMILMD